MTVRRTLAPVRFLGQLVPGAAQVANGFWRQAAPSQLVGDRPDLDCIPTVKRHLYNFVWYAVRGTDGEPVVAVDEKLFLGPDY